MSTNPSALAALQAEQAALTESVAQNSTVVGSVLTLLHGLAAQLASVQTQLAAALGQPGANDAAINTAVSAITALRSTLDGNTNALTAAVVANTPAATQPTGPASPIA